MLMRALAYDMLAMMRGKHAVGPPIAGLQYRLRDSPMVAIAHVGDH
jgi:hypothetical protein